MSIRVTSNKGNKGNKDDKDDKLTKRVERDLAKGNYPEVTHKEFEILRFEKDPEVKPSDVYLPLLGGLGSGIFAWNAINPSASYYVNTLTNTLSNIPEWARQNIFDNLMHHPTTSVVITGLVIIAGGIAGYFRNRYERNLSKYPKDHVYLRVRSGTDKDPKYKIRVRSDTNKDPEYRIRRKKIEITENENVITSITAGMYNLTNKWISGAIITFGAIGSYLEYGRIALDKSIGAGLAAVAITSAIHWTTTGIVNAYRGIRNYISNIREWRKYKGDDDQSQENNTTERDNENTQQTEEDQKTYEDPTPRTTKKSRGNGPKDIKVAKRSGVGKKYREILNGESEVEGVTGRRDLMIVGDRGLSKRGEEVIEVSEEEIIVEDTTAKGKEKEIIIDMRDGENNIIDPSLLRNGIQILRLTEGTQTFQTENKSEEKAESSGQGETNSEVEMNGNVEEKEENDTITEEEIQDKGDTDNEDKEENTNENATNITEVSEDEENKSENTSEENTNDNQSKKKNTPIAGPKDNPYASWLIIKGK